jgi:hypothetical protein
VTLVGVPVLLSYTDSNDNSYEIDTVISDGYSGTFSYEWTPERAGKYTVTATFMGDESYDSSFATTYVATQAAPEAPSEPAPLPPYGLYIIGAVIIVIVVNILVTLLLRKK